MASWITNRTLVEDRKRIYWLHKFCRENKCSAVAQMGDRLATTDMGACAIFRGEGTGELGPHLTQCGLGQGLSMYKVASWSIQPFDHNRHGPKTGGVPLWGRELGPHLTQCGQSQDLPAYQVSSWSMQPFSHNTPTLQTRQTDKQWSESTGQNILQMVTKKSIIYLLACCLIYTEVNNISMCISIALRIRKYNTTMMIMKAQLMMNTNTQEQRRANAYSNLL